MSAITEESLDALNLTTRSYNALRAAGVDTVAALLRMTATDILKVRNSGRRTLADIREALAEHEQVLAGDAWQACGHEAGSCSPESPCNRMRGHGGAHESRTATPPTTTPAGARLRQQLGIVVQLRALLTQLDNELGIVKETLDVQINAAALLVDGLQKQTDNAHAAASRTLATLEDVSRLLEEYRAMMVTEVTGSD